MKDGNHKVFYENGKVKYSVNYKDGKWDGLCEEFNEKGQALSLLNYKDGELNGTCKWFEYGWMGFGGSLEITKNYENGKVN